MRMRIERLTGNRKLRLIDYCRYHQRSMPRAQNQTEVTVRRSVVEHDAAWNQQAHGKQQQERVQ